MPVPDEFAVWKMTLAGVAIGGVGVGVEDDVVGVIVIYALLEQKKGFVAVDRELFKLLGAHAATALVGAQLFDKGGGTLPSLTALAGIA